MSEEEKPDHDGGYQGLFSHRELVKDMLHAALDPVLRPSLGNKSPIGSRPLVCWQGGATTSRPCSRRGAPTLPARKRADPIGDLFPSDGLIEGLDLDGMERVNTKYISDKLERRVGDVVWRIPYGEHGVLYLCLMLEFQSRDEKWITTRILAYQGHLYQQMLEEQKPGKGHDRVLPLLLPLVLYNGDEPWTAPMRLSELMSIDEGSPMWRYQPECCYILIDEKRFPVVSDGENLFATLCELEACQNPQQLELLLRHLRTQLRDPRYDALRRSFAAWLQLALLPPKGFHFNSPTTCDLDEVIQMTTVDIPAQIAEQLTETITAQIAEQLTETITAQIAEQLTETITAQITTQLTEQIEKNALDKGGLQRLRRSIGRVYERRFGDVPEALQERIEETSDMALLEAWFDIVIIETPQDITQHILGDVGGSR